MSKVNLPLFARLVAAELVGSSTGSDGTLGRCFGTGRTLDLDLLNDRLERGVVKEGL